MMVKKSRVHFYITILLFMCDAVQNFMIYVRKWYTPHLNVD